MALSIRTLTVATTVEDIPDAYPGGLADLPGAIPSSACIGRLVRLPAPMPGIRYGIWSAIRGACAIEMVVHPDIRLVIGRRRKVAALIHRSAQLRDGRASQPDHLPLASVFERALPTALDVSALADLHKSGAGLSMADAPFAVGGDELRSRALRVALWLCLRKGIPVDELSSQHLTLLPEDRFRVDATAVA